jgi:hypothetical protein
MSNLLALAGIFAGVFILLKVVLPKLGVKP